MNEICYYNARWIDPSELSISVHDTGFIWGVTITERIRTIRGKPFLLEQHLQRLSKGLNAIDQAAIIGQHDLNAVVERLATHNHRLLDKRDDLAINLLVTPGIKDPSQTDSDATVAAYSYRLPFHLWTEDYQRGVPLVTVGTRQVPRECWPPEIKCRSRMHYYQAKRQAQRIDPRAVALLLDQAGNVTETPTANIIAVFGDDTLVSPPKEHILPGITLQFVERLAAQLGLKVRYRPLRLDELRKAREIILTSSLFCMQSVETFDSKRLQTGRPVYEALRRQWHTETGLDYVQQADSSRQNY